MNMKIIAYNTYTGHTGHNLGWKIHVMQVVNGYVAAKLCKVSRVSNELWCRIRNFSDCHSANVLNEDMVMISLLTPCTDEASLYWSDDPFKVVEDGFKLLDVLQDLMLCGVAIRGMLIL